VTALYVGLLGSKFERNRCRISRENPVFLKIELQRSAVLMANTLVSLAYLTCLLNSVLVPKKTLKISPSRTVEALQLQFRGLIGNNALYNLPELR
jgi:hypothetical protein